MKRKSRKAGHARRLTLVLVLLWLSLPPWGLRAPADDGVLFREDFDTLEAWEPLHFPNIERRTVYEVRERDGLRVLAAESDASASALVHRRTFDVREYPVLRWRWQVDSLYPGGDYRRKAGDDYPLRVYVLFPYDPGKATAATRLVYGLAKAVYGRYPPDRSLNYIWANRPDETERVFSPYTDRAILIPLRHGPRDLGRWVEERVDLVQDYREAFGADPPPGASLAVMNDSDNTGAKGTSYIDFIEVRR